MTNYQTPTAQTYDALDQAFNWFNAALFDSKLEAPVFTLTRKRGAHGYFWAEQWKHREDGDPCHEIALNPDTMQRSLPEVLSTLVHEMTHLEQQLFGTPGKGGFHNKAWGELMDAVGLIPTSTGQPGGARTGRKVTHMIEEGGPFDLALGDLLATGFNLPWHTEARVPGPKKLDLSKTPHTCPECSIKAWAKLGTPIGCHACEVPMDPDEAFVAYAALKGL